MRRLLALTKKSLTKHGCAYWLIETNRVGKMPTPRYIPAKSVRPLTDQEQGIIGFEIQWSSGKRQYPRQLAGQGRQRAALRPARLRQSHLGAALGRARVENGWRVLYARTSDFVQKLQAARQNL